MFRTFTVQHVKPLLSDEAWQVLRRFSPSAMRRDAERDVREAQRLQGLAEAKEARANRMVCELEKRLAAKKASRPSLTDLAKKYRTDKWGAHRYTPHYERHLGYLRDEKFTLLEFGIGGYRATGRGGVSLRMWKEYFANARIIGVDIEDKTFVNDDRITAYVGSQTDELLITKIIADAGDVKVAIDDGSHQNAHVRASFAFVFPLLSDQTHYIIEDLQTGYWPRYGGSADPNAKRTSIALAKSLIDDLNYEEYTDDGYRPTYVQEHVVGLHLYHNLLFIDKDMNREGRKGHADHS